MSTNIRTVKIGDIYYQNGNGVPTHIAIIGTVYIDVDTGLFYTNRNGIALWSEPGGGGGIPDAPIDGDVYGRQNGIWVQVEPFLGFTPENVLNKVTTMTGGTDTYPDTPTVKNYVDDAVTVKFVDVTSSRNVLSTDYNKTLKIKGNLTLTIPLTGLQNDFICYIDVFDTFTLTWGADVGINLSGNEGSTQEENTTSMLYRDGATNNYRLRGEI
jgi:hypothetical protein